MVGALHVYYSYTNSRKMLTLGFKSLRCWEVSAGVAAKAQDSLCQIHRAKTEGWRDMKP